MTTIRRLTDSCVVVTTDRAATLIDPGFHTFTTGEIDLESIGDVSRVLITHEHGDHANPDFVRWLIDRQTDLTVYANQAVADLMRPQGIEVSTDSPDGVAVEDVLHEPVPTGATPPNRSFTIDGLFTHPGDSHQPSTVGRVMALPLITPWGSVTAAVAFARRVQPELVVPIHDFYLSASGRAAINGLANRGLEGSGIELVPLDWGESFTV